MISSIKTLAVHDSVEMLARAANLMTRASTNAQAGSLVSARHLTAKATRQVIPVLQQWERGIVPAGYGTNSTRVLANTVQHMQTAHTALRAGSVEAALAQLGSARFGASLLLS